MAPDKIVHLKGGALLMLAALAITVALWWLGAHWLSIGLVNAGLAGAASVEGAQWADNRGEIAAGRPARHDVSLEDFAASLAPCIAASVAVQLAAFHFGLPQWPS